MNLLFTICARAGSKGLKSKNVRDFNREPLVNYTIAAYKLFCREYENLYGDIKLAVNTDSLPLIDQVNATKIEYIYVPREEYLAGDLVAKIDVIKDTLLKAEAKTNIDFDILIDLDLTSPLRLSYDIKGTIDQVLENEEADIAFSVTESRRSPYFNMVCKKDNGYFDRIIMSDYACRQQIPVCYDMNASIYAYKRDYLLSNRGINRKAVIWEMQDTAVLDIDSETDLKLMEVLADYFFTLDTYRVLQKEVKNFKK